MVNSATMTKSCGILAITDSSHDTGQQAPNKDAAASETESTIVIDENRDKLPTTSTEKEKPSEDIEPPTLSEDIAPPVSKESRIDKMSKQQQPYTRNGTRPRETGTLLPTPRMMPIQHTHTEAATFPPARSARNCNTEEDV